MAEQRNLMRTQIDSKVRHVTYRVLSKCGPDDIRKETLSKSEDLESGHFDFNHKIPKLDEQQCLGHSPNIHIRYL
nr:hypothetical protein HmN_000082400 [Hymenolepis microstoma]